MYSKKYNIKSKILICILIIFGIIFMPKNIYAEYYYIDVSNLISNSSGSSTSNSNSYVVDLDSAPSNSGESSTSGKSTDTFYDNDGNRIYYDNDPNLSTGSNSEDSYIDEEGNYHINLNNAPSKTNQSSSNGSSSNSSTGNSSGGFSGSGIIDPGDYEPSTLTKENSGKLIAMADIIVGIIRTLGIAISVIAFAVIGFRYMMSSSEGKANYKETMVPYLIGAVMVFTIPNLIGIVYDLVKEMKID